MKRRAFLTATLLAPLASKLALAAPEPVKALVIGPERLELKAATNFAALTPAQTQVWARDLWDEAHRKALAAVAASHKEQAIFGALTGPTRD